MSNSNEPPELCPYCSGKTTITRRPPDYGETTSTYAVTCFRCMYHGCSSESEEAAQRKHDAMCRRLVLIDDLLQDILHPSQ